MVDTTGFVTALVINAAIAIVAISFFLYLRSRYPWCYDTRRNPKRRVTGTEPPVQPPGVFSWLPHVMRLPDAQVMSTAGLDALMLIKFFEMCATLFVVAIMLGIGILIPVNYTSSGDISDSFDQMSMANIPTGSARFWAHLIIGYLFSACFYFLAWHLWSTYLNLRHQHLSRWTMLGGNHTVLIHELPGELRSDEALLAYFQKQFPGQVRSAKMAKNLSMPKEDGNEKADLPENVQARDAVVAALEHDVAQWEKQQNDATLPDDKRNARPQAATKCFVCGKVDAIDHHHSELQRLNGLISAKQSEFIGKDGAPLEGPVPTLLSAFVTFHSSRAAVTAANAYVYDATPFSFEVKAAPELRDVYWPSLNMSFKQRSARTLIFNAITALLILWWMIPMGFLMGLSNLTGLAEKYSWLDGINSIPAVILGFIEAYLPALMLVVFFAVLPLILLWFSKMQGIEAHSWLAKSVIHKYFLFMVVNFFFGAIVGGAIFSNITALVEDVTSVPTVLGRQIPTVSNYFVNYVALAAFAGFPLQLLQAPRLIVAELKKKYLALTAREFEAAEAAPQLDYGVVYCPHLFIFLVATTYAMIAPIIIPFAACYFLLGWVVFKYQIIYVYVQKFESGGTFWPVVYSKMSSALFIAQLCLVGILGLKEVPAQAALVIPLPILTVLFDRYIHRAIKSKLRSLPLPRLVEIDTIRKAERVEREQRELEAGGGKDGMAGAHKSVDSWDRNEQDMATAKAANLAAASSVSAYQADDAALRQTYESTAGHAPIVRTSPRIVEEKDQNDVTKGTRSYVSDEERNTSNMARGPGPNLQQLGFPYADDEQERPWVEGDVPAYVQPELTPAVPAEVQVERADRYLSDRSAGSRAVDQRV